MSVVLLDPRWPTLIPLQAFGRLGGEVRYTGEVPIAVRWDFGELVAPEGEGVLVSTDPEHPEVAEAIAAGRTVHRASSLGDPTGRARAAMARALEVGEWESTRTHGNLLPHLHEEVAELVAAVERAGQPDGDAELCGELGDLLLQVLFHAALAEERGAFDYDDVVRALLEKLRCRAPYLFDGSVDRVPVEEQKRLWLEGKRAERTGPRG